MFTVISLAAMIVAVCLLIHISGVLVMAELLFRHREYLERNATRTQHAFLLMILFAGIVVLHISETCIWATFYYTFKLFKDLESSLYFSLTSYSTIGYGDVLLPERWRLLGPIEGVSGVLLCGVSTAFIFAVITAMFQMRLQQQRSPTAL
jgi:voltage-gated potassium channel